MALAKSASVRMMMVFPFSLAVASEMLSGNLGPARKLGLNWRLKN